MHRRRKLCYVLLGIGGVLYSTIEGGIALIFSGRMAIEEKFARKRFTVIAAMALSISLLYSICMMIIDTVDPFLFVFRPQARTIFAVFLVLSIALQAVVPLLIVRDIMSTTDTRNRVLWLFIWLAFILSRGYFEIASKIKVVTAGTVKLDDISAITFVSLAAIFVLSMIGIIAFCCTYWSYWNNAGKGSSNKRH